MTPLESLTREAAALADGQPVGAQRVIPIHAASADEAEVARLLQICNACRYCEGYCAVFPAMTRRLAFNPADAHYLANLCHNCGACLHACQYAPPHEFGVNLPRALARVRGQTYVQHAWPAALGALYQRAGLTLALALAAALALFMLLALARQGTLWPAEPVKDFYAIFPHGLMVSLFAPVFGFAMLALGLGLRSFWREAPPGPASSAAWAEASRDTLGLKHLGGGHGEGCNNDDDAFTLWRRRFHHLTFYGFIACFAATVCATAYHYLLGWPAPYAWTSLPKLLGVPGGVSLMLGSAGLGWLNLRRDPLAGDPTQAAMDRGFIALLFFAAATGLALVAARGTPALPSLLCVHLGVVMALFATMPYGKFAHGMYRAAALLKWAIEKRQPSRLKLAQD